MPETKSDVREAERRMKKEKQKRAGARRGRGGRWDPVPFSCGSRPAFALMRFHTKPSALSLSTCRRPQVLMTPVTSFFFFFPQLVFLRPVGAVLVLVHTPNPQHHKPTAPFSHSSTRVCSHSKLASYGQRGGAQRWLAWSDNRVSYATGPPDTIHQAYRIIFCLCTT